MLSLGNDPESAIARKRVEGEKLFLRFHIIRTEFAVCALRVLSPLPFTKCQQRIARMVTETDTEKDTKT